MEKKGRKPAAELAVVTTLDARRPPPPAELNEGEATEWRAIVSRMPQDWFTREHAMLIAYCRHVCRGRFIAQQIAAFETEWLSVEGGLQRLDKLHAMAERETKLVMALARSMRLTHQSRYKAETAYTHSHSIPSLEAPWDKYAIEA